ncbi:MAG: hypothetical protein KKG75_05390 [Nanoarchaeota archaeon]|nr:hypothetical protein [Nanoarchaeota archaeon]
MVTLLDLGLIEFLLPIFSMLLVFTILFGILQKTKFVSESANINVWIAIAIGILFALTPGAMQIVSIVAPWFMVMLLVIFSLVLLFLFMGVKLETIESVARNEAAVRWTIFILGIIILIAALTSVFGPIFGTPTSEGGSMGTEIQRSLFDPQVLTTVFILIIIGQAVRLIAQKD